MMELALRSLLPSATWSLLTLSPSKASIVKEVLLSVLFQQFIISPNPRDPKSNPKDVEDLLTTNSSLMTIVDPRPENIEVYQPFLDSGEGLLDAFLQIQWWVFW